MFLQCSGTATCIYCSQDANYRRYFTLIANPLTIQYLSSYGNVYVIHGVSTTGSANANNIKTTTADINGWEMSIAIFYDNLSSSTTFSAWTNNNGLYYSSLNSYNYGVSKSTTTTAGALPNNLSVTSFFIVILLIIKY